TPSAPAPATVPPGHPTTRAAYDAVVRARLRVEQVRAQAPRLNGVCTPAIELHRVHETLLAALLPEVVAGAASTAPLAGAPGQELRAAERELIAELRRLLIEAPDPAIARAMASMAAAVGQLFPREAAPAGQGPAPIDLPPIDQGAAEPFQTLLAHEHAAIWVYGVYGARTSAAAEPELFGAISAGYAAHRGLCDQLTGALAEADLQPVPAAPSYPLPGPLARPEAVRKAAAATEADLAQGYAWLVSQSVGATRGWAADQLQRAAVRALTFQATPENFPGASELADRIER
ncbi:MAG: DUF4439 domain-containing protein, partial [Nocardioides sp.]